MTTDFFPIVLGSDENAYATARCFYEAYGVKPLCLCSLPLVQTQRSAILTVRAISHFNQPEVFVKALNEVLDSYASDGRKLLVIPCSDYYTELMVRYYDCFGGKIANRFISEELFDRVGTKDAFYALCAEHGLSYPETLVVSPEERLALPERLPFPFPIVVKPENSNSTDYLSCRFEGKKKTYFFSDAASYLTMVKAMNESGYRGKLIVQRLIPGGDTTSLVINAYSGMDGKVRFLAAGKILLEEYSPGMLGNYAGILAAPARELTEKIATFLNAIGYVGFSNFDLKYDPTTDSYCLFELNPRHGRSSYYVYAAGNNLMAYLVEDVVHGEKPAKVIHADTEALWASVPKSTLLTYITDSTVKARVKALIAEKGITYTLRNPKEKSLLRRLRIERIYHAKRKTYKTYWFDKTKLI